MHENWMHIKYRIAPQWGKRRKRQISERSIPSESMGKGKGGGAWRHAFDTADMPSTKTVSDISTH